MGLPSHCSPDFYNGTTKGILMPIGIYNVRNLCHLIYFVTERVISNCLGVLFVELWLCRGLLKNILVLQNKSYVLDMYLLLNTHHTSRPSQWSHRPIDP